MSAVQKDAPTVTQDANLPHTDPAVIRTIAAALPAKSPPFWRPPNPTNSRRTMHTPTKLTILKQKIPSIRTDKENEHTHDKEEVEERYKQHEPDDMGNFLEVKTKSRPNHMTEKDNKEAEDEADEETNDEKSKKTDHTITPT